MPAVKSKNACPITLKMGTYTINEGDLVTVDSSRAAGSVGITAALDTVCGVATQRVDNSAGAVATIQVETGDFLLAFDSVADTDVGKPVYASSATVCTLTANSMFVGSVIYAESSTRAWVRVPGVDAYAISTNIGGSTGSTDNRVLRANGTGGSTIQSSAVTIDDSGNLTGVGTINTYSVLDPLSVVLLSQIFRG